MKVPVEIAPNDASSDDDGMYDFADIASADKKAAAKATALADAAGPVEPRPVKVLAAAPAVGLPSASIPKFARETLAYQRGATQKQKDRLAMSNLLDMPRDVYVPTALLVVGYLLYVASYAFQYHLTGAGVGLVGLGLGVITIVKAGLLVGFAILVAGPLGVSFGGLFTAALKLGAIAVFSDGCAAWVDVFTYKMAPGVGGSMISFPITVGIYWGLLIYFFHMDVMEARLCVIILNLFSWVLKWGIILLVLNGVLGLGGVKSAASGSNGPSSKKIMSERSEYIDQLKDYKQLKEAKAYIADGHQAFLTSTVDKMYAAGAKKIYFEVTKDINGKGEPVAVYVEMPEDSKARKKILTLRKAFYEQNKMFVPTDVMLDEPDEDYLEMSIR